MHKLSRRSVVRGSVALAAAATLARPHVANAAAKTASVWWPQGFVAEEDSSFRAMIADYEKASGNTIDYSLIPFAPLMQKIVSALTSGDVPDVLSHNIADLTVVPQNAWHDRLIDLTDVVEPQKSHYHPTALLASYYYNNVTKKRGYYQVPYRIGPAREGNARRRFARLPDNHHRAGRRQRVVPLLPERLRRRRHHHQGRAASFRRSAGQGGRDQDAHLLHHRVQRGLCEIGRAELE